MNAKLSRHLFLASGAIVCATASPAYAQTRIFDVPSQPVESAIAMIGRQGAIQIVAARKFTGDRRGNAVHGEYTAERALALLLEGTGLVARATGPQTFTVLPASGAGAPALRPANLQARADPPASAPVGSTVGTTGRAAVPEATPGQGADVAPEVTDAEIIVTSQRRSETAIKVPAALTAIAGANLKTLGVVNVADLQNVAPGLQISKGALGINITMRGIQTSDTTSKGEQDISFNVDNVYMGRPQEQQMAFFDVDRVEVLRGPQGTLYGRSATAGAINIITNAPRLGDTSGYLDGTIGNYQTRRLEGAVNIPLGDTLAIRVAGNANFRNGYSHWYDQTVTTTTGSYFISAAGLPAHNDENNLAGRASLLFQPNDGLSVRLTFTAGKMGGQGQTGVDYDNLVAAHFKPAGLDVPADPVPAWVHDYFRIYSADVTKKVGPVQFVLAASHQFYSMNDQVTSGQNPAVNSNSFKLIQQIDQFRTDELELRMSNSTPSRVDYTVGANYFKEDIDEDYHTWLAPVATWSNQSTWKSNLEPKNNTDHKSWGVYGQGTFHLTDRIGLVGGLRYTHDELSRVGTLAVGAGTGACTYPNPCTTGSNVSANNGGESDNKLTWRVGANFQLNPRNLFYASVATGFKGGGFNDVDPNAGVAAGPQPYKPESLIAYEVGYKGHPLSNVTFASSLFFNDFQKQQIAATLYYGAARFTYTAIAHSQIYGWENELTWRLDPKTTISASASYEHSKYVDFLAGTTYGSQVQWAGLPLDKTPHFVGTIAIDRAFDLANGASVHLRLASLYNSGYVVSSSGNMVQFHQGDFTRTDASLSYAPANDAFLVEVFVRNIENKVQLTSAPDIYYGASGTAANGWAPNTTGYTNGTPFRVSDPRMYGVRLRAKF